MIRDFHNKRKKITGRSSGDFGLPEVGREIERQAQEKEEIENRRNKRKLIFWSIVIFGTVAAAVISIAFLLLLGIV